MTAKKQEQPETRNQTIRFPWEIYIPVQKLADKYFRSFNAQVVWMLRDALLSGKYDLEPEGLEPEEESHEIQDS